MDLCYRKRLLYQLSHNHFPTIPLFAQMFCEQGGTPPKQDELPLKLEAWSPALKMHFLKVSRLYPSCTIADFCLKINVLDQQECNRFLKYWKMWAVVVAQFAELSLLLSEVCGLNPVISIIDILNMLNVVMAKIEAVNGKFTNSASSYLTEYQ